MAFYTTRDAFIENGGITSISLQDVENPECGVCLDAYHFWDFDNDDFRGEEPVQLPCRHIFGSHCILRWTLDYNTCPYCRAELFENSSEGYSTRPQEEFEESAFVFPGTNIFYADSMDGVDFIVASGDAIEQVYPRRRHYYSMSLWTCHWGAVNAPQASTPAKGLNNVSDTAISDRDILEDDLEACHRQWMTEYYSELDFQFTTARDLLRENGRFL